MERTLWVGLNGAGAVRQVNLTTMQAGVQFSLGGVTGLYDPPSVASALSVMPGSPNTVAVSAGQSFYGSTTAIYDNGVQRPNTSNTVFSGLAFSPSGTEIYGVAGNYSSGYYVMTVDATGITATTEKNNNVSSSDIRYDSGRVYLTNGEVLDSEQGTLLGTFYLNQNQPASGPVVPDSTIGRAFILESVYGPPSAIGAYDISTFVLDGNIGVSTLNDGSNATSPVRWGQNGLAFRTTSGVYILTSPLVRDLSKTPADVGVGAMGPASGSTGTMLTYTLTITNYGPNSASPVVLNDSIPQGTVFSSATTSQGYCSGTYVVLCNLGTLANNGVATVTINVTALTAGAVQNMAQVSAAQGDPNLSNNMATTNTVISGPPYNPVPALSSISPSFVQAGTGSFTLTLSGNQFTSTSQVLWNGSALPTTYSSSTQLTAQVDGSLITAMGWALISVSNPAPGGGLSASQPVTVYNVDQSGYKPSGVRSIYPPALCKCSRNCSAIAGQQHREHRSQHRRPGNAGQHRQRARARSLNPMTACTFTRRWPGPRLWHGTT